MKRSKLFYDDESEQGRAATPDSGRPPTSGERRGNGGPSPDRRGLRRDEPRAPDVAFKQGLPVQGARFNAPVPVWQKALGDEPVLPGSLLGGTSNAAAAGAAKPYADRANEAKLTSAPESGTTQAVPFELDD